MAQTLPFSPYVFFYLLLCFVGISGGAQQAGEEKKYLERELLFYKSSARGLKKKLREAEADVPQLVAGSQEKAQNTQPSTSERDPLAEM